MAERTLFERTFQGMRPLQPDTPVLRLILLYTSIRTKRSGNRVGAQTAVGPRNTSSAAGEKRGEGET